MDFIVSKVAMSICALMFMTVAGGIVEHSMTIDDGNELDEALRSLERLTLLVRCGGFECEVSWSVPSMHDGSGIGVDICHSHMTASADGHTEGIDLQDPIHTWEWQGEPLTQSVIEERDLISNHLKARTGDVLGIKVRFILVDELPSVLLFIARVT